MLLMLFWVVVLCCKMQDGGAEEYRESYIEISNGSLLSFDCLKNLWSIVTEEWVIKI